MPFGKRLIRGGCASGFRHPGVVLARTDPILPATRRQSPQLPMPSRDWKPDPDPHDIRQDEANPTRASQNEPNTPPPGLPKRTQHPSTRTPKTNPMPIPSGSQNEPNDLPRRRPETNPTDPRGRPAPLPKRTQSTSRPLSTLVSKTNPIPPGRASPRRTRRDRGSPPRPKRTQPSTRRPRENPTET